MKTRLVTKRKTRHLLSERLEGRQLMAADVGDDQLLRNWVPPNQTLDWSDASLQLSRSATAEDWQAMLQPYADRLSNVDKSTPTFRVNDLRYDAATATTLVYLQQTLNGFDVVNAYANLVVQASGKVAVGYSSFVSTENLAGSNQQFTNLSPEMALASLSQFYNWPGGDVNSFTRASSLAGGATTLLARSIAREAVEYVGVYVPTEDGLLEPSWRLNVQPRVSNSWLDASVSQIDGEVLFVADWTSDAVYEAFFFPRESPSYGRRFADYEPVNRAASPFGWLDTNGIVGSESLRTRGNNTIAYRDTDANNRPDLDSYVNGGAGMLFFRPLDLTQEPASYAEATTVNLFYATNRLHDVFATNGFYAEAGNFQQNNYGATPGLSGDPLLAEDLDGGGFNSASMTVPPDGRRPRMQMRLFNYTTPARSSSLDNSIIVHEFAHGVSMRLTGGPANSSALSTIQSAGMGEGWSDFFAMLFTQYNYDPASRARSIGTYVLGQPADGPGMRTQRYSYDMTVNTHTFADIRGATDPHLIGEVWAATLWDLNWALIGGSSLDGYLTNVGKGVNINLNATNGGNNVAFRTVLYAMKLQPVNPTFLQARDAILHADELLNDGANQETIWRVFARRGMGYSAVDNWSAATNVIPAFDIPSFYTLDFSRQGLLGSGVSTVTADLSGLQGDRGTQVLRFTMEDIGNISLVLTPLSPDAQLTAQIRNSSGKVVRAAERSAPGRPLVVPTWSIGVAGGYTLKLTTTAATPVKLQAARNAALESQVGDATSSSELNIDGSARNLFGGSMRAVVGHATVDFRMSNANDVTKFVDISTTGTPLDLANDQSRSIQTTVGNRIIPAGTVTVNNNGVILAGSFGEIGGINVPLSWAYEFYLTHAQGLFPFWDNIDARRGNVYWEERTINGVRALIVQWDHRPLVPNVGSLTFQAQLFASGPVWARYVYKDLGANDGGGATIGVITPNGIMEYQRVSVANGDYVDIRNVDDIDEYRFSGTAGERVDVAFEALGTHDLSGSYVRLLDGANNALATASTKPLSTTTTVSNYDLGFLGFVLPRTGTYYVQVVGKDAFEYYLAVGKSLAIDTENASGEITPARSLTVPSAATGFMNAADSRDVLDVLLTSGQSIRVVLSLSDSDLGTIPRTSLRPQVNLTSPSGAILATSSTFNTDGQIIVTATATDAGRYRIDLSRLSGGGEYYLSIENNATVSALIGLATPPISLEVTRDLTSAWHNPTQPLDVSGDQQVTAIDALLVFNELNARNYSSATGRLPDRTIDSASADFCFDTNGDGYVTAADALLVIDELK